MVGARERLINLKTAKALGLTVPPMLPPSKMIGTIQWPVSGLPRKEKPQRLQRQHRPHRLSLRRAHYLSRRPCQGVKESKLIEQARLWRPHARLPPAMLFSGRKDPRLLRDTSPQQSPVS
jgi:hypothetical protein